MKAYAAIFRMRFINTLQYRAAAFAGLATQFAWGFMEIFAFDAFFRSNPGSFAMSFSETVTYIWIQQAFLALFMMWFWESDIAESISDGAIAYEMIRPVDLYGKWFCHASANRVARAVLRCAPILIAACLVPEPYRITVPDSAALWLMSLSSAVLGAAVVVSFSMLMYISLFFTMSPMGVRTIVSVTADFLAGAIIPVPFFPQPYRRIAELLPFAAMQNMPLRIFSGNLKGEEALHGILLQAFWLMTLFALGRYMMRKALKKVIVQGG